MSYAPEISSSTLSKIRKKRRRDKDGHENAGYHDCIGGGEGQDGAYQQLCFNVNDFQLLAKKKLRKDLYEYLSSGTDDEHTLLENRLAYQRWFLRPRVLSPVGRISTRTYLRFGRHYRGPGHRYSKNNSTSKDYCEYPVSMPVFVSPAGVHALCDEQHGECATARACSRASILFGLSQHSTRSIEEVATSSASIPSLSSGGSRAALNFYQAYILKDRERTLSLIRRAVRAGYQGIFLTVDSVRFGYREADARNGFNALPPPHRLVNYDDHVVSSSPEAEFYPGAKSTSSGLDQTYNSQEKKAWDQNSEQMFEQNVSWEDVTWIKRELANEQRSKMGGSFVPLIVKGIMTAEDAILAVRG